MKIRLMILVTVLINPFQARAESYFYDGNSFLNICENQHNLCTFYITVVSDTLTDFQTINWIPEDYHSCVPKSVTGKQLKITTLSYMKQFSPVELTRPASGLIKDALLDKFPC